MTITAQEALQRTIEHREIFPDEMLSIMRRIMSGEVTPVMIAALTVGLRVKKETIGEISATADDGEIMGVRHREWPVEGVQFHPEAILTEHGHALLRNFLDGAR